LLFFNVSEKLQSEMDSLHLDPSDIGSTHPEAILYFTDFQKYGWGKLNGQKRTDLCHPPNVPGEFQSTMNSLCKNDAIIIDLKVKPDSEIESVLFRSF
jgi:hypothetical protein